jgi:hypothetical protein
MRSVGCHNLVFSSTGAMVPPTRDLSRKVLPARPSIPMGRRNG